jgi:hypothetical protein
MTEPAERPPARRRSRTGRLRQALAFGLSGRQPPLIALTGFLPRGGIALLASPAIVFPSVIGIAEITGVRAISIAGQPTPWLVEVALAAALGAAVWLVVASLLGALADVWLVEMALDETGASHTRLELPGGSTVLRLIAIRVVCAVPLAVALVWAGSRIFEATYNELTTPTNLTQPLPLRVVFAATDAVVVVIVVWLATETLAAIAVRRQILACGGIWRSLAGAVQQIVRRPLSTCLAIVVSYGASVVATVVALAAITTAFDWCRIAARDSEPLALRIGVGGLAATRDFRPVVFALAAVALALAWAAALALSAVTSAWRSAAFSQEVADALAVRVPASHNVHDRARLAISGTTDERSGIDPTHD